MGMLTDKVALVTGSADGIGRAIAEAYAEEGAFVVLGDLAVEGAMIAAEKINQQWRKRALGMRLDVGDRENVQQVVTAAVGQFGRLDILVNNAGVLHPRLIVDFPLEEWRETFRVNMEGTFLCSQAAARQMIRQGLGGSIINISSASANKADKRHSAYSASKAAIVAFTRVLALELGEYGIRANAILPGATETRMLLEEMKGDLLSKTPLRKLAQPRDQANVAVFLASSLASHVTGEYIVVSGGEFMNA
jgi:NAD(P)-dependent dehydrogenase (short-subunit alcohol dehydrogenase family)